MHDGENREGAAVVRGGVPVDTCGRRDRKLAIVLASIPYLKPAVHLCSLEVVISIGIEAQVDEQLCQHICISVRANPILGERRGEGLREQSGSLG